jgi:membrane-associated protein
VKSNIELILIGIVLVSLIPVIIELVRGRRRARNSDTRAAELSPASRH